jgi:O-antigen/teichoic acid export membrane protein
MFMKKSAVADMFALTLARVITMISSLAQAMILARNFDKFSFGTYSQSLIIISIMTTITGFGLSSAVNYFVVRAEDIKSRQENFNSIVLINIFTGIIGALVLIIFNAHIGNYFNNPVLSTLIIYVAFRPMLTNLITDYQNLLVANSLAKTLAKRNIIISILQVLIIGIVSYYTKDLVLLFIFLILLDLLQLLYFVIISYKMKYKLSLNIKTKLIINILKYAVPLGIALMVGTLNIQIDKMIIGKFFSTEELAVFSNASRELPFSFIVASITTIVLPKIIKLLQDNNKQKVILLWSNSINLGIIFTWLFGIVALLLSRELFLLLYTEKYIDGLGVFRVFVFAQMVRFTYFGMILNALGKTRKVLLFSAFTLIINTILNFVFLDWFGFVGPAYATLISIIIIGFFQLIESTKELNCKLNSVLKFREISWYVIVMIGVAVIGFYLKGFLYYLGLNNIYILIIVTLIYCLTVLIILLKNIKILFLQINTNANN